jgi:hypothetical protein
MEINDFVKQKGEFLKAEVFLKNPNAVFEISGEATLEHNEKYDTDRFYIPLKYGEVEYIFDCSRTNARTITQKLGADTKKWIGRTLLLETYKTKTSDGKMVDAINVKDVK